MEDRLYESKIHPHNLRRNNADNGWVCDGRKEQCGCRRGCTGLGQSTGWPRFRCIAGCDYDLCDQCLKFHAA